MGMGFLGLCRDKHSDASGEENGLRERLPQGVFAGFFLLRGLLAISMACALACGFFFPSTARALYFEKQQVTDITEATARDVHSADMDGDGDMDILAIAASGYVVWHENVAGNATQWTMVLVEEGWVGASSGVAADMDGDGDMDIVACNQTTDEVAWWENNAGNGKSWTKRTMDASFDGAVGVWAADMDADGDMDVAGAANSGGDVSWFENKDGAGGQWQTHLIDGDFAGAMDVHAADLDGDGDTDVLGAAFSAHEFAWWENQGAGVWSKQVIEYISSKYPYRVQAVDMDGDGDLDVAGAGDYLGGPSVVWFENAESGWTTHVVENNVARVRTLYVSDLDSDGDMDMTGNDYQNHDLIAWENTGDGWSKHILDEQFMASYSTYVEDLDADGKKEIMAVSSFRAEAAFWKNPGDLSGTWPKQLANSGIRSPSDARAADMDGDGDPDIVACAQLSQDLRWFENNGGGSFWNDHTIENDAEKGFSSVDTADFDDDDDRDAVSMTQYAEYIEWWENPHGESGDWTKHAVYEPGFSSAGARKVYAVDMDGDDAPDILWFKYKTLAWLKNPGTGEGAWSNTNIDTSLSLYGICAADIDGDDDADVIGAANSDGDIVWFENSQGDGQSWTKHTADGSFSGASWVVAADMDKDGDMDILGASENGDDIAWWENQDESGGNPGNGALWVKHPVVGDFDAVKQAYADDMDDDGDMDILGISPTAACWWENTEGDGNSWQMHQLTENLQRLSTGIIANLDGDADLDFAASGTYEGILWFENTTPPLTMVLPASATEGDDLSGLGTVSVPEAPDSNVEVSLSSDDTSEVSVDASVTILSGNASAVFNAAAVVDNILDGTRTATVTASADGYVPGSAATAIHDAQTGTLTVELPSGATEGDNTLAGLGTVTAGSPVDEDVTVDLVSDDRTELQAPATATILAGENSATFDLFIMDDNVIDGPQTVEVSPSVEGWTSVGDTMIIADNETLDLNLTGPNTVFESDGTLALVMELSVPGLLTAPVEFTLDSDAPSQATLPATVSILAGQSHRKFDLTVIDDLIYDEDSPVNFTASSAGWPLAQHNLTVLDDESYPTVQFETDSSEGDESATEVELAVTLTPGSYQTVTVDYSITGGTADGDGIDYTLAAGQLTFDPGETSATIPVAVVDDDQDERREDLIVTLSDPTNASLGTVNVSHTYEIIDDDYEPTARTVCASGCDYSSIQSAIDDAWEGDTVEVGPGVYTENLDFKGRRITLQSTDGANKTKINGGCAGSAVRFVSGEGSDSVLEGFAIENGCAEYGAGIFLDGSSPAISHCQILENRATAGGGGIFAANGASPTFSHFIVQDNYSTGYGGGLAVESSSAPEFTDGLIADNHANSNGGGVHIHACSPVILRTEIADNSALQNGGGLFIAGGAAPEISKSYVQNNRAYQSGGGAHVEDGASPVFTNVISTGNSADREGGAFCATHAGTELKICSSTVAENTAAFGGSVWADDASLRVHNSILFYNGNEREIDLFGDATADVSYSNVNHHLGHAYTGEGNISYNPEFVSNGSDWHLQDSSDCIDEGSSAEAPADDIDAQARPFGAEVDMGADERNDALPEAAFSASAVQGDAPLSVTFEDLSRPATGIVSWIWDFGDGQASGETDPVHVYSEPGRYTVSLTVEESGGGTSAKTRFGLIQVAGNKPAAAFSTSTGGGFAPLTVAFTDETTSPDAVASRLWDFGDGTTSFEQNPEHVYSAPGTYRPRLTVTDADGDSDSALPPDPVVVEDPDPKASFYVYPATGDIPLAAGFFDSSFSFDHITSWTWSFGEGFPGSSEQNPAVSYPDPGQYDATLTVVSQNGEDDATSLACVRPVSTGTTWTVCSSGCDFKTIQGAIDGATDGDTIEVSAGTYEENVTFGGKGVTVVSLSGSANTIIDGDASGSVVSFVGGEDTRSVLDGFRLRNGSARFGGGVYCDFGSSPMIRNCDLYENAATDGGGVAALRGSRPVLASCYFYNNSATSGGGLACLYSSSPVIVDADFYGNKATDSGGAVFAYMDSSPVFESSLFRSNRADVNGGGIFATLCSIRVKDCVFDTGNYSDYGSCVYFRRVFSGVVERCEFRNNSSDYTGCVSASDSFSVELVNCMFDGNSADYGAAACFDNVFYPSLVNCSGYRNYAYEAGSNIYGTGIRGGLAVKNCILWDSDQDAISLEDSAPETVTFSDVFLVSGEPYPGEGNINLEPEFADGSLSFRLNSGSPCRNTGTAEGAPSDDLDGKTRPLGAGFDMGCYEADNLAPVIYQHEFHRNMDEDGDPLAYDPPEVEATDGDNDTLEWSILTQAQHGTATASGTGSSPPVLDYVPEPDWNGDDSFVVQVSDGQGETDTATLEVTVRPVEDPPTIEGTPDTSVAAYSDYEFVPQADDADEGDTLSFLIENKPGWAGFSTQTGTLTGTPNNAHHGTYEDIVITVKDSTDRTASLPAFDLTVNLTPQTPSAATGEATSKKCTRATLNGTVDPNGGDTEWYFEYWQDPADVKTTATSVEPASLGNVSVSANAYGLDPETSYSYRLVAENDAAQAQGEEMSFTSGPMFGDTIYVEPEGQCDDNVPCFASVSHALEYAAEGTTLILGSGAYYENLSIGKGITFQIEGTAIIAGEAK